MNAINAYRKVTSSTLEEEVLSASPTKLILIVYDELIKTLKTLSYHPDNCQMSQHSINIIIELMSSLSDKDEDKLIVDHLKIIYETLLKFILLARLHNDMNYIQKCLNLIQPIHEAWNEYPK